MRPMALPAVHRTRPRPRVGAVRPGATDRGSTSLELVVLFPILLLMIFGFLQGALYLHGRNVALAAAEQGVRAGRADGQPDPAGTAVRQARAFLADTGELDNMTAVVIVPLVTGTVVRLTVTARTVSLLPGVPGPQVQQSASGARERFTSGGSR